MSVTATDRAAVRSLAGIVACSWVALTEFVGKVFPSKTRVAPAAKLDPFTVRSTGADPATAASGVNEVICAAGLLMRKPRKFDSVEPSFTAMTGMFSAVAMRYAEITAVTWLLLTKVVGTMVLKN
jgi:hypothetical protein